MCGIFGLISNENINDLSKIKKLALYSEQRGKDSSGIYSAKEENNKTTYTIDRASFPITKLINKVSIKNCKYLMAHSRLITTGSSNNQPILYNNNVTVIHNGIIVNHDDLFKDKNLDRFYEIDTEIIAALCSNGLEKGNSLQTIANDILKLCKGTISTAIAINSIGKLILFSNNGSLFVGSDDKNDIYFSSEKYPLLNIDCKNIRQIWETVEIVDIPLSTKPIIETTHISKPRLDLIPTLGSSSLEANQLVYRKNTSLRCSKCILPETMPFIKFDSDGICNYCKNYKIRNRPRELSELKDLVHPYVEKYGNTCIVPFSGGRDSCYSLHLIVNELGLKPITYTYDWGMVTDLGRRNISRMCGKLGVENIIIAADIVKKRRNIRRNFTAWLKSPNLGMVSILTAGDKHFFRHVETVKKQTGIPLNIWGVNPLEVTYFKSGFLGIKPDFEEEKVYSHGVRKQIRYQSLRLKAMTKSFGYFNRSIFDTLSGEYYRSFTNKNDYYHLFDYWKWNELEIDDKLLNYYEWEKAEDTPTTWRIGDGTAAMYNYIYYTVAGFTEHDTFRSNQIREGEIDRAEALKLVSRENKPRYPNIKWYLEAIGMDFTDVINTINKIPSLY